MLAHGEHLKAKPGESVPGMFLVEVYFYLVINTFSPQEGARAQDRWRRATEQVLVIELGTSGRRERRKSNQVMSDLNR